MKARPSSRSKPDPKPDKRPAAEAQSIDGVPVATRRRLEHLGKEIAELRTGLARLADQRASERTRKQSRPSP